MNKKCVVIYNEENKPIGCYELKEFKDVEEFLALQSECAKNVRELEKNKKRYSQTIENLNDRIIAIEKELAFNRGEITREEYEKWLGNK